MKRSDINAFLAEGDAFMRSYGYVMPPFAYYTPDERKERVANDSPGILTGNLGWDITDFGGGNYAEKIMISKRNQICPMHRDIVKAEEMINRGGGTLVLELFESQVDGSLCLQFDVRIASDRRMKTLKAGGHLALQPGESVTLMPGRWHAFWGEGADVMIGEVSTVNDDLPDNIFRDPVGRFSSVEEDADPVHLLVSDYHNRLK